MKRPLRDVGHSVRDRVTDDEAFAKALLDMLFGMFRARAAGGT